MTPVNKPNGKVHSSKSVHQLVIAAVVSASLSVLGGAVVAQVERPSAHTAGHDIPNDWPWLLV